MHYNFPQTTFDKIFYNCIRNGNHYAIFFKDTGGIYAISIKKERLYNYCGCPVLRVIDLNSLEKQDPEFVWKLFEQTLKELEVAEDF